MGCRGELTFILGSKNDLLAQHMLNHLNSEHTCPCKTKKLKFINLLLIITVLSFFTNTPFDPCLFHCLFLFFIIYFIICQHSQGYPVINAKV